MQFTDPKLKGVQRCKFERYATVCNEVEVRPTIQSWAACARTQSPPSYRKYYLLTTKYVDIILFANIIFWQTLFWVQNGPIVQMICWSNCKINDMAWYGGRVCYISWELTLLGLTLLWSESQPANISLQCMVATNRNMIMKLKEEEEDDLEEDGSSPLESSADQLELRSSFCCCKHHLSYSV